MLTILATRKAHCIDSLRNYIQCHADTTLLTFKYIEGYAGPWPDFRTTHQCFDWNSIYDWAQKEMVDVTSPGKFVHPKLGPVIPGAITENPLAPGKKIVYIDL